MNGSSWLKSYSLIPHFSKVHQTISQNGASSGCGGAGVQNFTSQLHVHHHEQEFFRSSRLIRQ